MAGGGSSDGALSPRRVHFCPRTVLSLPVIGGEGALKHVFISLLAVKHNGWTKDVVCMASQCQVCVIYLPWRPSIYYGTLFREEKNSNV